MSHPCHLLFPFSSGLRQSLALNDTAQTPRTGSTSTNPLILNLRAKGDWFCRSCELMQLALGRAGLSPCVLSLIALSHIPVSQQCWEIWGVHPGILQVEK